MSMDNMHVGGYIDARSRTPLKNPHLVSAEWFMKSIYERSEVVIWGNRGDAVWFLSVGNLMCVNVGAGGSAAPARPRLASYLQVPARCLSGTAILVLYV